MKLFAGLTGRKKKEESAFKKKVHAMDCGSRRAKAEIRSLSEEDGSLVVSRVANARVDLYSQAACEGDRKAQYLMGISLAQLGEKEVSLEWLVKLAKKGDVRAMLAIADGYTADGPFGDSVQERRHWYRKAAEAGSALAAARLGDEYAGRDEKQAVSWYKKSAAQGCHAGWMGLGRTCYKQALGMFGNERAERRRKLTAYAEEYFRQALDSAGTDAERDRARHSLEELYAVLLPEKRGNNIM